MKLVEKLFLLLFITITMGFAEPNVHQIFNTMESGHLDEAHNMIQEVLKAHPNSAKAHYVDAEILVRLGNKQAAQSELAIAQQLSPNLSFAKPDAVAALEARIQGGNVVVNQVVPVKKHEDFPWMMLILTVGTLILIILIWRSIFTRKQNSYANAPAYNNMGTSGQGYPNNSMYNNNQGYSQGSGLGSNIMSGLATGAAAGVGMVAAEEVMHHFMDRNDSAPTQSFDHNIPSSGMDDNDFGINDSSSWDDGDTSDSNDDTSW